MKRFIPTVSICSIYQTNNNNNNSRLTSRTDNNISTVNGKSSLIAIVALNDLDDSLQTWNFVKDKRGFFFDNA